ncbi:MAG TPA: flagellar biosynthetic protein FliO [Hyphomonadaceae bacterium]|nr:flagellar biosynthetic protein FliO [Hyphomonadaceae bacterium]
MDVFDALRAAGALILVLGILLGGAWALRRYGGSLGLRTGAAASDLRVVEWRNLDMRRKLAVVRWGASEHLLVLSPTGDTMIASRDAPAVEPTVTNSTTMDGAKS